MSSDLIVHTAAAEAPIACTLTPGELRGRTADLSTLARRALVARTRIDGGERLAFIDTPAVERELSAAVAAEAACCAFLAMRLERREGRVVLEVTGPHAAAAILAELFA